MIVYAKEDLHVKEMSLAENLTDLPIMSFLIGIGKEKKTVINFFYREFTGGVSGLDDFASQTERLRRLTGHWRQLCRSNRDMVSLGDANLCAFRWNDNDYSHSELADMVHGYLLDTNSSQVVNQYTRSEIVRGGQVSQSCIDHCYTNSERKLSDPEVLSIGDSDHLGVIVTKYSREQLDRPKTVKKRSYKNVNVENFLEDVLNSDINKNVTT